MYSIQTHAYRIKVISILFEALIACFGTMQLRSTAYHLRTEKRVERLNKTFLAKRSFSVTGKFMYSRWPVLWTPKFIILRSRPFFILSLMQNHLIPRHSPPCRQLKLTLQQRTFLHVAREQLLKGVISTSEEADKWTKAAQQRYKDEEDSKCSSDSIVELHWTVFLNRSSLMKTSVPKRLTTKSYNTLVSPKLDLFRIVKFSPSMVTIDGDRISNTVSNNFVFLVHTDHCARHIPTISKMEPRQNPDDDNTSRKQVQMKSVTQLSAICNKREEAKLQCNAKGRNHCTKKEGATRKIPAQSSATRNNQ